MHLVDQAQEGEGSDQQHRPVVDDKEVGDEDEEEENLQVLLSVGHHVCQRLEEIRCCHVVVASVVRSQLNVISLFQCTYIHTECYISFSVYIHVFVIDFSMDLRETFSHYSQAWQDSFTKIQCSFLV